jgi:hypothetical protein
MTTNAEAVHQRGSKRPHQPEQGQPDGQGKRDVGVLPAELALQRFEHNPRKARGSSRRKQGQERSSDNDPAIVDAVGAEPGGKPVGNHQES